MKPALLTLLLVVTVLIRPTYAEDSTNVTPRLSPSTPSPPLGERAGVRGNVTTTTNNLSEPTLTLTQCFDEALAHNDELLQLRHEVERAAGTKLEIRSRELPRLSAQASAGLRGGSLYDHTAPFAVVTAQFAQPLLDTGIPASWRRGQCEVVAAQQRLNVAISDQLQQLRFYYLQLQRLQQLIDLDEAVEQRLQANVTGEQQRRDVGMTGPRPVLQAKVQLLATRAELTAFRREEFDLQTRLAEIMGRPMNPLPRPGDILIHQTVSVNWREQERLALQQRADLKFLRALIQIAAEDRRVVQAGYFPFVSLVGSTLFIPGKKRLYQATPIIQGQTPLATEVRYGASLTWQVIDNAQVTGISRRLEAIRQEYEISLRQLEANIPRELARIARALANADATFAALNKSATEADENLRLIESRISLGEATQLDFSNAQRNLLAVRHGMVDALFQSGLALAELDRVTGRYLEFAEPVKGR